MDFNTLSAGYRSIYSQQNQINQQLLQQLSEVKEQYNNLQHQVLNLIRGKYGQKTEKLSEKFMHDLFADEDIPEPKKEDEELERISYTRKKSRNGHRNIPEDLPRVRCEHKLSDEELICPCGCGRKLHKIGEVISEQIELIPAKIYVKQHVRFKYAGCIHGNKVVTAPMPTQPIDKGLAGPGLLANVLIDKYDDHLPLYRQSEKLARHNIEISDSTLSDWVLRCADLLLPLVQEMEKTVLSSFKIHTDDTRVPVKDARLQGKTREGHLWVYSGYGESGPPCIVYKYTPNRQYKWVREFLKDYHGYIQADAFQGYDILYDEKEVLAIPCTLNLICGKSADSDKNPRVDVRYLFGSELQYRYINSLGETVQDWSGCEALKLKSKTIQKLQQAILAEKDLERVINGCEVLADKETKKIIQAAAKLTPAIEVACMAHARRKFFDIAKNSKKSCLATTALNYIGKLYKIERAIKDLDPIAKRAIRKRKAKPILKEYKKWLQRKFLHVLPKNPLGQAIKYSLKHWPALTRYLANGMLDIDNNKAERLMRVVAVGRSNWLFAGSDRGGNAAAVIYSLIETCKLNHLNPYDYLRDVLARLPNTLMRDIDELLPQNWKSPNDTS